MSCWQIEGRKRCPTQSVRLIQILVLSIAQAATEIDTVTRLRRTGVLTVCLVMLLETTDSRRILSLLRCSQATAHLAGTVRVLAL